MPEFNNPTPLKANVFIVSRLLSITMQLSSFGFIARMFYRRSEVSRNFAVNLLNLTHKCDWTIHAATFPDSSKIDSPFIH